MPLVCYFIQLASFCVVSTQLRKRERETPYFPLLAEIARSHCIAIVGCVPTRESSLLSLPPSFFSMYSEGVRKSVGLSASFFSRYNFTSSLFRLALLILLLLLQKNTKKEGKHGEGNLEKKERIFSIIKKSKNVSIIWKLR